MSTDTLRPTSPDPTTVELPPSREESTYSPSQLPINSPSADAQKERLGVDHVYRPKAVQTDDPAPSASSVPRRFASLTATPSAAAQPPDPPPNPDFATMAFQSPAAIEKLVRALHQNDMNKAILHHQAFAQERARQEREATRAAGEVPGRGGEGPRIIKMESIDGSRLKVGNQVVGRLAARKPASGLDSRLRSSWDASLAQYADHEAKMKAVADQLRKEQIGEAEDAESTDRDDEEEVARALKVGKKKKKKGKKKKAAVVSVAQPAEGEEGVEGREIVKKGEEEDRVEAMIQKEWGLINDGIRMENFHRSNEEYLAKVDEALRAEEAADDFGEVTISSLEKNVELQRRQKQKEDDKKSEVRNAGEEQKVETVLLDLLEADDLEQSKKESKKAKKRSNKASVEIGIDSEITPDARPKPATTEHTSEQELGGDEVPEDDRKASSPVAASVAKFASKTVFDQLGPSSAAASAVTKTSEADPEAPEPAEPVVRSRKDAKKESRKLARAEKFKDVPRIESVASLPESQTSSHPVSATTTAPSSGARADADAAARKAAWKAEKRAKARQAKPPAPAHMPAVSIAPPPAQPAPMPARSVAPIAPWATISKPGPMPVEASKDAIDDDATPKPFTARPLPDDDPTPTWPTIRLPTVSFEQHHSPAAPQTPLPAPGPAPLIAAFGSIKVLKAGEPPAIITTLPSTSTVADTDSTLSVSIIEPGISASPAPALTFGTISPEDHGDVDERNVEEELEKIREGRHGRSLTAPPRESIPDPHNAIASREIRQNRQSRNVSSPAAIQYEPIANPNPPPTTPLVVPSLPPAIFTPAPQGSNTPITTPDFPIVPPAARFTPLFPSIAPGIPIELVYPAQVEPYHDPANDPAPPPHVTPDQTTRGHIPVSAPAIVTNRPLVAPIVAGPLLSELTNPRARAPVVYPSLAPAQQAPTIPQRDGSAPQVARNEEDEEAEETSSSSSDEVIVRLPPPPSRKPTPRPQTVTPTPSVTSISVSEAPASVNTESAEDEPENGRNDLASSAVASPNSIATSLKSIVPPVPFDAVVQLEEIEGVTMSSSLHIVEQEVASDDEKMETPPEREVGEIEIEVDALLDKAESQKAAEEFDEKEAEGLGLPAPPALEPVIVSTLPSRPIETYDEAPGEASVEEPIPTPSIPGIPPISALLHTPVLATTSLPTRPLTLPPIDPPARAYPGISVIPRLKLKPPPQPLPYGPCPLARSWTLYFADTSPSVTRPRTALSTAAHYSGALVKIFTASTAEDLFGRWKAFRRIVARATGRQIENEGEIMRPEMGGLGIQGLKEDNSFHFFTKGVLPMWEDPMAAKGGKLMFAANPASIADIDFLFLQVVQLLVSGQVEEECPAPQDTDICVIGASLSKRKVNVRIEVWLGGSAVPPQGFVSGIQALLGRQFPNWKLYPYKSFKAHH